MAIEGVIVVSVPVTDQDRAKAFYVDTLGFALVREDDSIPGFRWIQVAPPRGTTALTLGPGSSRCPPAPCVGWCCGRTTFRQTTTTWWPRE
jgi:catechol 2,3-dioxygenase-like lactoylglutathione lyase family enzyme